MKKTRKRKKIKLQRKREKMRLRRKSKPHRRVLKIIERDPPDFYEIWKKERWQ